MEEVHDFKSAVIQLGMKLTYLKILLQNLKLQSYFPLQNKTKESKKIQAKAHSKAKTFSYHLAR